MAAPSSGAMDPAWDIQEEFRLMASEEAEDWDEGESPPGLLTILAYTNHVMSKFDPSHDFDHSLRVLALALLIHHEEPKRDPKLQAVISEDPNFSRRITAYAALMHDLNDHKYVPISRLLPVLNFFSLRNSRYPDRTAVKVSFFEKIHSSLVKPANANDRRDSKQETEKKIYNAFQPLTSGERVIGRDKTKGSLSSTTKTKAARDHEWIKQVTARPDDFSEDLSTALEEQPMSFLNKVKWIMNCVSWSTEQQYPRHVGDMCRELPQLAFVQDADRLDALGAVGIARTFAFGANRGIALRDTLKHFHEKLFKLPDQMKTNVGRELANERLERMNTFLSWSGDEAEHFLLNKVDTHDHLGANGLITQFGNAGLYNPGERGLEGTVQWLLRRLKEWELQDPAAWRIAYSRQLTDERANKVREFATWWMDETGLSIPESEIRPLNTVGEQR
jgi:hypothetical protein